MERMHIVASLHAATADGRTRLGSHLMRNRRLVCGTAVEVQMKQPITVYSQAPVSSRYPVHMRAGDANFPDLRLTEIEDKMQNSSRSFNWWDTMKSVAASVMPTRTVRCRFASKDPRLAEVAASRLLLPFGSDGSCSMFVVPSQCRENPDKLRRTDSLWAPKTAMPVHPLLDQQITQHKI